MKNGGVLCHPVSYVWRRGFQRTSRVGPLRGHFYCSNSKIVQVSALPVIRSACSFANTVIAPVSRWWSQLLLRPSGAVNEIRLMDRLRVPCQLESQSMSLRWKFQFKLVGIISIVVSVSISFQKIPVGFRLYFHFPIKGTRCSNVKIRVKVDLISMIFQFPWKIPVRFLSSFRFLIREPQVSILNFKSES